MELDLAPSLNHCIGGEMNGYLSSKKHLLASDFEIQSQGVHA